MTSCEESYNSSNHRSGFDMFSSGTYLLSRLLMCVHTGAMHIGGGTEVSMLTSPLQS